MSKIQVDNFFFYNDKQKNFFVINQEFLDSQIAYIIEKNILHIYIGYFDAGHLENIDFLSEIPFVEEVIISDMDIDLSGLVHLKNLKFAILSVKNKKQQVDFSKFKYLEYLYIDWYTNFPDLSKNHNLIELTVFKFRPKSKSLKELKIPESLNKLKLVKANIINLNGLDEKIKLNTFELHYCKSLILLEGLEALKDTLEVLIIDYCKKINDYTSIENCRKLKKIILGDSGDIKTIKWIVRLRQLKHFSFWNTRVLDGDTSPCVFIDYVSFNNYQNYSNKVEEMNNK